MRYESLAGKAPFLPNVGVAVNRKMLVWDEVQQWAEERFVTAWDGHVFSICHKHGRFNACEIPAKKMRPMTPRECALLPHGTMFRYETIHKTIFSAGFSVNNTPFVCNAYCLQEDLTDDIVSSLWKPLETECE